MGREWEAEAVRWMNSRLQRDLSQLPYVDVALEVRAISHRLVSRFISLATLGGPEALVGADADFYAEAVGLMAAVRLRPFLAKQTPTGEVERVKVNQNEFQFTNPDRTEKPVEQIWLEEATLALGRVNCIRQAYQAAAASFSPFALSGPTRAAKERGCLETLMASTIRLLTDDWCAEDDR
jgi:hypothetical protein